MELNKEQKEHMNKLYKEYGLSPSDIHSQNSRSGNLLFKIIKRSGIEKIQKKANILVSFECIEASRDYAAVKGRFEKPKLASFPIQTFGSASKEDTQGKYLLEIAEKRCLSRGVLKLTSFYEHGFYGEDEIDNITTLSPLDGQYKRIEILTNQSNLPEDRQNEIFNQLLEGFPKDKVEETITYLEQHEAKPNSEYLMGNKQGEIKEALKDRVARDD